MYHKFKWQVEKFPVETMSLNLLNISMNNIEVNPFYWHFTGKLSRRNIDSLS